MTRILLVRHGQTDSNAGGVLQGHLPTPLNDVGHRQAAQLAGRLARFDPAVDALVTSDLPRAVETAAPIERALGLTATLDPVWRERAFGSFEGKTVGDTELWRAATGTLDPPGAEPLDHMRRRVAEALTRLADRSRGRRCVAVVTHGGVMRTTLRLLIEGRLALASDHGALEVGPILNASILHLTVDRVGEATVWRVVRINDVDHLDASEQSARDVG